MKTYRAETSDRHRCMFDPLHGDAHLLPMPPWVASVPRSTSLLKGRAIERLPSIYCYRNAAIVRISRPSHVRIRSVYTHVSPTTINPRPEIPQQNVKLHDALLELGSSADTFVNISRLQLALRGLAAQDAVIRVAGKLNAEARRTQCQHSIRCQCTNGGCSAVNGTTKDRSAACSIATCRPSRCGGTMGTRLAESRREWRATAAAVRSKLHNC
jgi:hypothetical protein